MRVYDSGKSNKIGCLVYAFINISVIICGFDLVVFILFFNGIDLVPDKAIFPLMIGGSILGFILPWFGSKGVTRNVGIWGNFLFF